MIDGDVNGAAARQPEPSSLLHTLRVVRERWWVIALAVLVTGAGSLALSLRQPDEYTTAATLLLRESGLEALVAQGATLDVNPERDTATNLQIIESRSVAERVRRDLGLERSAKDLLEDVDARLQPESDIVEIQVTDTDPRRAAAIATSFAEEYTLFRQEARRRAIREGAELLRQRIQSLPPDATAERSQLQASLRDVTALEVVQTGDAEVIDPARPPAARSAPTPKRDLALGVLFGLVLGTALAFFADVLDRRVKSAEAFETVYGLRALATIPLRQRLPRSGREREAEIEPYRILRTAMAFLGGSHEVKVVVITSAVPREGKTTVALGLARAAALSGTRVAVVECDLRRPSMRDRVDLGDDPRGLSTALIGRQEVDELFRTPVAGVPNFQVLPSGPIPPNATELLQSTRMRSIVESLRDSCGLVILDAPPLLPVADAQVLMDLPEVDAVLVVARPYEGSRDQARRARAILDRMPRLVKGLVVNGARDAGPGYQYYGIDGEGLPGRRPDTASA